MDENKKQYILKDGPLQEPDYEEKGRKARHKKRKGATPCSNLC